MAYSIDTREMVMEYLSKGHTHKEAIKELGVRACLKSFEVEREEG